MRAFVWLAAASATLLALPDAAAYAQPSRTPPGVDADFARFTPQPNTVATRLDFTYWDRALQWFVLRMGQSMRQFEGRPDATVGTRFTFGHDSPYRLEGNRVAFSMLPDNVKSELTTYRQELEQLADTVPIARLSRNEQLAYWINLHNVAMVEQIALAYPVKSPDAVFPGGGTIPLDDARFITVSGMNLSPRDIRTRIVYSNWSDPRVIYAFWHGDIGGPSISREAFTAEFMADQLDWQAVEFVNALRGTQKDGSKLLVSNLYEEARPFYFRKWPDDLRKHLGAFAEDEVKSVLGSTRGALATIVAPDIADLSKGERDPGYNNALLNGEYPTSTIDPTVARLLAERTAKLQRYKRQNPQRKGRIIVGPGSHEPGYKPEEIK